MHGFVTDGFLDMNRGVALVREEIHRLFPEGCDSVLYYEDGSVTGNSAYRLALQAERAAGSINVLTTALTAGAFNTLLLRSWDLVVFARQVNRTAQVYDARLQVKLCQGQKALVTDFYNITQSEILRCAGARGTQPMDWNQIVGDGRLLDGSISLADPGYPSIYTYTVEPLTVSGPWLIQARNEANTGSILGLGTSCAAQTYFVSSLTRGMGGVEAAPIRTRVLVGGPILASFRLPWPDRPSDEWDAVSGTVTLDRPGPGGVATYTLFDDGTNGDAGAGDNYWTRAIPQAVSGPGAHVLRASFDLTEGGCTVHREAEYSVVAMRDPETCTGLRTAATRLVRPGEHAVLGACVNNLCLAPSAFQITVSDTRGWLCYPDSTPAGTVQFVTPTLPGGTGTCFSEVRRLLACIPPGAADGENTVVTYRVRSLAHPSEPEAVARKVVRVLRDVESDIPEPAAPNPTRFSLSQNRPNPFDTATNIVFEVPGTLGLEVRASVRIYNAAGQQVRTLLDGPVAPGRHSVVWDGRDDLGREAASGVYFYRLDANGARAMKRLLVLRR